MFLLAQLVRLFVGADMDFDIQLVLRADAVPDLALADGPGLGPHLGWNTWLLSGPPPAAVDDPVFDPDDFPLACT